jgi:YVTN family beta-propeller protein
MEKGITILFRCIIFFLPFLAIGCAPVPGTGKASDEQYKAQLTLFLNGPERSVENITFDLTAVNIIAEDGTSREITARPLKVNSLGIAGRQLLLGERFLPEGRYRKIQLVISKALIQSKDKTSDLALPPEGIELPIDITLQPRQNITLFLHWDADASIPEGFMFRPAVVVKKQMPELVTLLVYVTNEASDNVSVINRQLGKVVGTILVGKRPRGITVNPRRERLKVYVANSLSNTISVIDPNTNTVENEVEVRFGKGPEDVAVARVSSQSDLIFTANYGSDNVSMIDASTLQEFDRVDVGSGPVAIAADPPVEVLSDARSLSQADINTLRTYREKFFNVYVANRNSKSVSVLRISRVSMRCEEVTTLAVGWDPVALHLDYARGRVYVANYSFNDLSVINLAELARGNGSRAVFSIKDVGASVTGVLSDPDLDRIYLLRDIPAEIVILRIPPDNLTASQSNLSHIMGAMPVDSLPRAFLMDPEARKMYVASRGKGAVAVIDKTTRRKELVIPVGEKPYSLTMFPR